MNQELNTDRLKSLVLYDPESGNFFWKERNRGLFQSDRAMKIWNTKNAGVKAGSRMSNGYINIRINRGNHYAHRLAWLYMTGEWPADQVDHVSGVRDDNRFINLREASVRDNAMNQKRRVSNLSGVTGVSWKPNLGRWWAFISINRKASHIGFYDDFFEACCARKSAEKKHGYHINHGRAS